MAGWAGRESETTGVVIAGTGAGCAIAGTETTGVVIAGIGGNGCAIAGTETTGVAIAGIGGKGWVCSTIGPGCGCTIGVADFVFVFNIALGDCNGSVVTFFVLGLLSVFVLELEFTLPLFLVLRVLIGLLFEFII
jgi:hypothetical protein